MTEFRTSTLRDVARRSERLHILLDALEEQGASLPELVGDQDLVDLIWDTLGPPDRADGVLLWRIHGRAIEAYRVRARIRAKEVKTA